MCFHVITVAGAVHLLQHQKCVNMHITMQLKSLWCVVHEIHVCNTVDRYGFVNYLK